MDSRAVGLAAGQWGLFTTAQARALGVSPQTVARMCARGDAQRLRHGVYRIAGVGEGALDDLRADWIALEPVVTVENRLVDDAALAVVSHRSAAVLHQLGDLDADVNEFRVGSRRQTRQHGTRFHLRPVDRTEWTVVSGLPVTRIPVTISDLAAVHADGGHLAGVVRDAVMTAHVDVDELAAALAPHAHCYETTRGDGEALLQRFLNEAGLPASVARAVHLTASEPRSVAAARGRVRIQHAAGSR